MVGTSRSYEASHRWISFQLETREFPRSLWVLLGEAASKIEHIAGVPLKPSVAAEMHRLYLAKGVLATTAIEGNTLSEDEVRLRLDGKLRLPDSREYLGQEVDNVARACTEIWQGIERAEPDRLSLQLVERYNALVLEGLRLEEGVVAGVIRNHPVVVGTYRGAPAEDCRYLVERLCEWLEHPSFTGDGVGAELRVPVAILQAILAHLYIAWIHPFGDGNGRTARLIEFQLLLRAGFPTPAAHLLSNHYNLTRSDYYRALDQARRPGGVTEFIAYAVRGLVDGLREQIEAIRGQQMGLAWKDYVSEVLRGSGPTSDRQRTLVLSLSGQRPSTPRQIVELTPALARLYATKTAKTLTRDLNTLQKAGLVERTPEGYVAATEMISAFLPRRSRRHERRTDPAGRGN